MSKLHIITGAPGAGKSTLLRHLKTHPFVTVDFDELPEADGSLMGVDITSPTASAVWPAYNRLWVKIAAMMLRAGRPVLLLCPLTPDEWADASAEAVRPPPSPAWARLDCSDAERRTRLAERAWEPEQIDEAVEDAVELRASVAREFTSTGRSPAEVAAAVADWITDTAAESHTR
ncbi:AAA family ATPase [Streptomyces venezuelae]|uniref:AAA family ATPase n=1 Tax=Streptomyces venezuelae TaxID=54571 RepID=UPI003452B297